VELKSTLQKEAGRGAAPAAAAASSLTKCAGASGGSGLEECLPYPVLGDQSLSFGLAKGQTCENDGILLRDMLLLCVEHSNVALLLSQIIPFLL
jgi:septal ring factor EnvC (AmiA/AmiB activator)